MLKQIVSVSPELHQLVDGLELPLSAAQQRHVRQIADDLITTEGRKDLSNLYRHIVANPTHFCIIRDEKYCNSSECTQ